MVSMEVEPEGSKIYIATVDLERLGKWVKGQRKKGKMQYLYVLGQIPHGLDQLKLLHTKYSLTIRATAGSGKFARMLHYLSNKQDIGKILDMRFFFFLSSLFI